MVQSPARDAASLRPLHAFELARVFALVRGIRDDQRPAFSVRVWIEIGHQIVAFLDRSEVLVSDPVVERKVGHGLVGILQVEHDTVGVGMEHQCRGGLDPADVAQQKVGESVSDIATSFNCLEIAIAELEGNRYVSHLFSLIYDGTLVIWL